LRLKAIFINRVFPANSEVVRLFVHFLGTPVLCAHSIDTADEHPPEYAAGDVIKISFPLYPKPKRANTMRFHPAMTGIAATAAFVSIIFQFGGTPSADAHSTGPIIHGHHIKTPAKVQAVAVINVKDFGATGNGVTDDSTAIQNAANNAAVTGKGVFFPAGTYLHASPVQFAGVPVTGVGAGSVLIANNPSNCAVILSGANVSLQNMTISTQGLAGGTSLSSPYTATLLLQNATSFTVANDTIVTGTNMWGAFVLTSTVGVINSVAFDGTGSKNDVGVEIDQGDNVTVINSLFQNETDGVSVSPVGGPSQFIAILSNTIGNVTYPIVGIGVFAENVNVLDVGQNSMQMLNSTGTYPVYLLDCNNFTVSGNDTWGGAASAVLYDSGGNNNFVTQNTIHNCGGQGIYVVNVASSALQVTSNLFGECGLTGTSPVISVGGAGADASGASTFVQNNSYQGHVNNLDFYVQCSFTAPNIPAANVTGNTQTQTALSNMI
jgi:hypothetical protein